MFNPEKILGNLLMGGTRRRGSMVSGGALLGLAGVAMEAVEHLMNQQGRSTPPAAPPSSAPPPPPPGAGPRGAGPVGPPPPPPPPESGSSEKAVLLIRAMIAAAAADGVIDSQERSRILEQAGKGGLSQQELDFLNQEMENPQNLEAIVAGVDSPQLATQVYTVSLAALEVDNDAERQYLARLAEALGLSPEQVASIERQLG